MYNEGNIVLTTDVKNPLLIDLLKSPILPKYSTLINKVIEDEKLKREEFYNKITDQDKAEFINGEIIMHSPVKYEHNKVGGNLYNLLSIYVKKNDLGFVGYEKILITLTRNDYEPDICFFKKETALDFKSGQMLFPAPDFVVEILSPTTENIDRKIKFEDYALHNIEEYWIIDPEKQTVEQFLLDVDIYKCNLKSDNGIIKSKAIKDFTIDIKSIFDEISNLEQLKKIIG
ncbi:MAG: hypothetical protein A2086_05355 [Spirochaetes bacterium GWD1_27_9]|nr:MAG: hypothetical protein A2Z98_05280 [Spirochaetes bacterium GWB1_27_13]OHD26586.1 MAG: hypothetical protein A2Y34_10360 [Spirochaetes bacterium GWC1_27_15]OHD45604.1 MAG: hypothetical protein A2086_05355 [Spirochaetes bacterium GWD1_27_9]